MKVGDTVYIINDSIYFKKKGSIYETYDDDDCRLGLYIHEQKTKALGVMYIVHKKYVSPILPKFKYGDKVSIQNENYTGEIKEIYYDFKLESLVYKVGFMRSTEEFLTLCEDRTIEKCIAPLKNRWTSKGFTTPQKHISFVFLTPEGDIIKSPTPENCTEVKRFDLKDKWIPTYVSSWDSEKGKLHIESPDLFHIEEQTLSFARVWFKDMGPILVKNKAKVLEVIVWEDILLLKCVKELNTTYPTLKEFLW